MCHIKDKNKDYKKRKKASYAAATMSNNRDSNWSIDLAMSQKRIIFLGVSLAGRALRGFAAATVQAPACGCPSNP
ncbi:MAG: hypothetical protein JNM36_14105 [Chitinophagales bacterium]|jgi:hypothetical protein|nr:hypothetical protein [Chitinophagales bacterium]